MKELFRGILSSGVSDIFMIEGWRNSEGAQDEYNFSKKLGTIQIHDLDPQAPTNQS